MFGKTLDVKDQGLWTNGVLGRRIRGKHETESLAWEMDGPCFQKHCVPSLSPLVLTYTTTTNTRWSEV